MLQCSDTLIHPRRGNVIDLAVALILGGAFGIIVNSLVVDIFSPFIGQALASVNLENSYLILHCPMNVTRMNLSCSPTTFPTPALARAAGLVTVK
jgi:hypothetical protein